jgi:hypothetical protein
MSPLLVQFLRRVAWVAVLVALFLLVGPRTLRHFGLIGPRAPELVESAARSLQAAQAYGADDEIPSFRAAEQELARARRLLDEGHWRVARQAAGEATDHAIEAQRTALARAEADRRAAQAAVDEVDRRLVELEELYARAVPRLDKAHLGPLLSLIKEARQIGAGLILDHEQKAYRRVLAQRESVLSALDSVGERMRAAVP